MSALNNFKRANKKSYQQIMYDILRFSDSISQPQLFVPEEIDRIQKLKSKFPFLIDTGKENSVTEDNISLYLEKVNLFW